MLIVFPAALFALKTKKANVGGKMLSDSTFTRSSVSLIYVLQNEINISEYDVMRLALGYQNIVLVNQFFPYCKTKKLKGLNP